MTRILSQLAKHAAAVAVMVMSLMLLAAPAAAQDHGPAPTVAVLYFTNSALVNHADFAPLSKGIADLLITRLSQNPAVRVVERDRLQAVLEELDLQQSDRIDDQTAVRIGKVLGAQYMLAGGFVIDPSRTMQLDIRAVNVSTTEVEYAESVTGKADNVLQLIADLGRKVNDGLRLPPIPATGTVQRSGQASNVSPADQYRAFFLVSKSIEEQDRKNFPAAIALLREALDVYPGFERARVRLASLERGTEF